MGQIQTALAMELSEAPAALRNRAALVDGPSGCARGFSFVQLERFTGLLARGLRERCRAERGGACSGLFGGFFEGYIFSRF